MSCRPSPPTPSATRSKNALKPWLIAEWCLPADAAARFVARLEDVRDVYARPVDPARPLLCFAEGGKELRGARRPELPPAPGQPARVDHEYTRQGSASLLLWCAPPLGQRHVTVTTQRTRVEVAEVLRDLVDRHFPAAEQIVLVWDNRNTPGAEALYHTVPPEEAKRIWDKLEVHPPPIHASGLNIAECELRALAQQCLARRLGDLATLRAEIVAWATTRNAAQRGVAWHFTTAEARTKLTRLYPTPVYAN